MKDSKLHDWTGEELSGLDLQGMFIDKIPKKAGRRFISERHYSGGCGNAPMVWGLCHRDHSRLLGAIAFHTPSSENVRASVFGEKHKDRVTELHRMVIVDEAPKNTGSWFISRALSALKDHKPRYWGVLSFADTTEGHDGTVYQAANAAYCGTTDPRITYKDDDGRLRNSRQCGENITPEEAEGRGWEVVEREEKHRYLFFTPDEYQSKDELRGMCKLEFEAYP